MQWCTADALLSVSNNNLEACFTLWAATNSFSASFCELRHSGFSSLSPWQILVVVVFVGPCPVRFFFRPTPSRLSPGRSTCFIACCKTGLID